MQNVTNGEIPLGLGMALAQNTEALKNFTSLSEAEKQAFISKTHGLNSKQEMAAYVNSLTKQG